MLKIKKMKKLNFFLDSVLLLVLLCVVVSCSNNEIFSTNETEIMNKVQLQKQKNLESLSIFARFGSQTLSYNTSSFGIPLVRNFTSVSVNGNTTLQISVSNIGSSAANVMVYSSVSGGIIRLPAIPAGSGAYSTYSYPISGWSSYVKVSVSSLTSGSIRGNIIVTSF
jgi:hypothetical protein